MPRTRSLAWAELKIGIVAVGALVIAAVLIFVVGGQAGLPWQQYHLKTTFSDVRGLKEGALVRLAGVEVGNVSEMRFVGAGVEITMKLSKSIRDRITTNSRASIGSLSLLGEPVVDISAAATGTPHAGWDFVRAGPAAGQVRDVAESASTTLNEATQLLRDVQEGRGTIGRLFTDEVLFEEVQRLVQTAGDVTEKLNQGHGTLGALIRDEAAYRSLKDSLDNLEAITRRIRDGEGSLGRLFADESFSTSLSSATSQIDELAGKLNRGEGSAGRLINEPELYDRLQTMATSLDRVMERLDQGEAEVDPIGWTADRHR